MTKNKGAQRAKQTKARQPPSSSTKNAPAARKGGWKGTFNAVMKQHNPYTADGGKVCSYATQQQRKDILLQGLRELRHMGFKFTTVYALRGKHIQALMQRWEGQYRDGTLSPSTIQNRLSVFRTFAHWLGKDGMVQSAEHYLQDKTAAERTYTAQDAKTWSSHGKPIDETINAVKAENWRFGNALALQQHFGLRSKESLLIRPHLADKGDVLIVSHGTKGGRTRYIPIETTAQRALLDELKATLKKTESLVPKTHTYAQCRNQYYYTLRKHGIKRTEGITAHGLRHEHLNQLYEHTTGHKSPVDGGTLAKTNPELDSYGRYEVAERAGHSRESIAAAYIGGKSGNNPKD